MLNGPLQTGDHAYDERNGQLNTKNMFLIHKKAILEKW